MELLERIEDIRLKVEKGFPIYSEYDSKKKQLVFRSKFKREDWDKEAIMAGIGQGIFKLSLDGWLEIKN